MHRVTGFDRPKRIWIEDGHIMAEACEGTVIRMSPESALALSNSLASAGRNALTNKIIETRVDSSREN